MHYVMGDSHQTETGETLRDKNDTLFCKKIRTVLVSDKKVSERKTVQNF